MEYNREKKETENTLNKSTLIYSSETWKLKKKKWIPQDQQREKHVWRDAEKTRKKQMGLKKTTIGIF